MANEWDDLAARFEDANDAITALSPQGAAAIKTIVSDKQAEAIFNHAGSDAITGSGTIWFTDTPPTDWLICNGASLSTTTYAALFAVIGYTFGGAGANFNLPDLQGKYATGKPSGGTLGGSVGTALTDEENRATGSHTHDNILVTGLNVHINALSGSGGINLSLTGTEDNQNPLSTKAPASPNDVEGTNAPYLQINYIIKT